MNGLFIQCDINRSAAILKNNWILFGRSVWSSNEFYIFIFWWHLDLIWRKIAIFWSKISWLRLNKNRFFSGSSLTTSFWHLIFINNLLLFFENLFNFTCFLMQFWTFILIHLSLNFQYLFESVWFHWRNRRFILNLTSPKLWRHRTNLSI